MMPKFKLPGDDDVLDPEVEKTWKEFWASIIEDENGNVSLDQIKRELSDYHVVLHEVARAYDHITNGHISKPNTAHRFVIDFYEKAVNQGIKDNLPTRTELREIAEGIAGDGVSVLEQFIEELLRLGFALEDDK